MRQQHALRRRVRRVARLLAPVLALIAAGVLIAAQGHSRHPGPPRGSHPSRQLTPPPGWPIDVAPIRLPATVPAIFVP